MAGRMIAPIDQYWGLMAVDKYDEAGTILENNPEDPACVYEMGERLYETGGSERNVAAVSYYLKAVKLGSSLAGAVLLWRYTDWSLDDRETFVRDISRSPTAAARAVLVASDTHRSNEEIAALFDEAIKEMETPRIFALCMEWNDEEGFLTGEGYTSLVTRGAARGVPPAIRELAELPGLTPPSGSDRRREVLRILNRTAIRNWPCVQFRLAEIHWTWLDHLDWGKAASMLLSPNIRPAPQTDKLVSRLCLPAVDAALHPDDRTREICIFGRAFVRGELQCLWRYVNARDRQLLPAGISPREIELNSLFKARLKRRGVTFLKAARVMEKWIGTYRTWISRVRDGIGALLIIARRNGVTGYIRRVLALLVWEDRLQDAPLWLGPGTPKRARGLV